jgi:hypothetical protein
VLDNWKCPFGTSGSLARSFFNHAATFSNVIAFILPGSFHKDSVQNKLNKRFHLVHGRALEENSFTFKDQDYGVRCVFQIWARFDSANLFQKKPRVPISGLREKVKSVKKTTDFELVNAEQHPDIAVRRTGVNAGKIFLDSPFNKSSFISESI